MTTMRQNGYGKSGGELAVVVHSKSPSSNKAAGEDTAGGPLTSCLLKEDCSLLS